MRHALHDSDVSCGLQHYSQAVQFLQLGIEEAA